MIPTQPPAFLPAILGAFYQRAAHGELVLEQNDGGRRLFWSFGKLVFLQSDVAGEQFGNYLLRQGILDLAALKELLADAKDERLGDKVVHWGLLSSEQRNQHLAHLYELILLNALEHSVVRYEWREESTAAELAGGVPLAIDHRKLVWHALTNLNSAETIPGWIGAQKGWKWQAPPGLLSSLGDLPIDPQQAYALGFLGPEPLEFDTLLAASGLDAVSAARLLLALWATGGLVLAEGELPSAGRAEPAPVPEPVAKGAGSPVITGTVQNLAGEAVEPTPKPLPLIMPPVVPPEPAEEMQIEIMEEEAEPEAKEGVAAAAHPSGPIRLDVVVPRTAPARPAAAPEEPPTDAAEDDAQGKARKYYRLAKHLQLQERTGDAIQALDQSVRLDPDSADAYLAWLMLGRLRMTNPAWSSRAVDALQNASRLHPKSAEPWALLGEIYHRKGFRANAKGCFKKAIELDPSVPIPQDFSMEDREGEVEEKPPGGMFGMLKGLMKR